MSEDQLQCVLERLDYSLGDRLPVIKNKSLAPTKWDEEMNTKCLAEKPWAFFRDFPSYQYSSYPPFSIFLI